MNNIYADNILDHASSPRNTNKLKSYSVSGVSDNILCGDKGEMYIRINAKVVEEVGIECGGCAISIASMSIMSDYIKGKTIKELESIMPSDVYNILGISVGPSRANCALLGYRALESCLRNCDTIDNK